jgi:YesN/AraC family two-component response regulator
MSRIWQIHFGAAFWDEPSFLKSWKIQSWRLSEQLVSRVQIILAQILEEYEEKSAGYERMIRLKLKELALLLERTLPRIRYPGSDEGASSIDEVVEYIQLHYSNDFSLSSLSSLCGLTPSYFSRVFKAKTGTPVFEYVNRVRVQKARALLKKTEMSIIEIAFAVGYNNVSFFNRYFRKLNRMSPREYRKYIRR